MEIFDILIILAGAMTGTIMGFLPGISASITVVLFFPILVHLNPINTICFYGAMVIVSQYMGSVTAIKLGVPGEQSSLPAVREGYPLSKIGLTEMAIKTTALFSAVGSVIALIFFAGITFNLEVLIQTFANKIQLAMVMMILLMVTFSCNNKIYINFCLLLFGCLLGKIGYNGDTGNSWGTFGYTYLELGVPSLAVLTWLFVFPTLYHTAFENTIQEAKIIKSVKKVYQDTKFFFLSIRSSIVGFIIGVVPFSWPLSSQIVWTIEKWLQKSKYKNPNIRCLVGAETANNSAVTASLIPLLMLGLPITASEMIIYDIIVSNGFFWDNNWFSDNINILLITFFVANIIGFILAWPMANYITKMFGKSTLTALKVAMIFLLIVYFYRASEMDVEWLYAIWLLVLAPIGFSLRKLDLIPIVIGYFLVERFLTLSNIFIARITF